MVWIFRHRRIWDESGCEKGQGGPGVSGSQVPLIRQQHPSTLLRRTVSLCNIEETTCLLKSNTACRQDRRSIDGGERAAAGDGLFCRQARPIGAGATGRVRHFGHRGSAFNNAFNEAHILAISQALCDVRRAAALPDHCSSASTPTRCGAGLASALEVFCGQRRSRYGRSARRLYADAGHSRAIISYNKGRENGWPTAS